MTGVRPSEALALATESLDRVATVLVARLADMSAAQNGWPSSSSVDSPSAPSKTTFCEVHGKERCECGGGTPFANLSDPTGDAAMRLDRAAGHRREAERLIASIFSQARRLEQIVGLYGPRAATDLERQETLASNERDHRSCSSCARWQVLRGTPKWEPAFARLVLEEGGEPVWLCQWCWRWVRSEGALPPVAQVERHHKGERVRKPA